MRVAAPTAHAASRAPWQRRVRVGVRVGVMVRVRVRVRVRARARARARLTSVAGGDRGGEGGAGGEGCEVLHPPLSDRARPNDSDCGEGVPCI